MSEERVAGQITTTGRRPIVRLTVDGQPVQVPEGVMVSAAVAIAGATGFRRSVSGSPRAPLCGMGICYECRVTIDGRAHAKSCQIACEEGMEVQTDG
jgi:D-hydroxyproline dehydrogenase subunit gamma